MALLMFVNICMHDEHAKTQPAIFLCNSLFNLPFQLFFHSLSLHHLLFSWVILLLSSTPMLSLCSVYSCLMSSRAASSFRGFLEGCTFRAGRTARLCCTISEVSLIKNTGQRSQYTIEIILSHEIILWIISFKIFGSFPPHNISSTVTSDILH